MNNKSRISDEIVFTVMLRLQKGESLKKLAEEYGIGESTIKRWRKGKNRVSSDFNASTMTVSQEKQIKQLEQKVETLTLLLEDAIELLKKDENEN
jgi:transposase-like protein